MVNKCCMADKYGKWCEGSPLIYRDTTNSDMFYCRFHAPKGLKKQLLDEYNKEIFEKINSFGKEKNGSVRVESIVLDGPLTIDNNSFEEGAVKDLVIENIECNGEIYIKNMKLERLQVGNIKNLETLNINSNDISQIIISDLEINKKLSIDSATPMEKLSFDKVIIQDNAVVGIHSSSVKFQAEDVSLQNVTGNGKLILSKLEIKKNLIIGLCDIKIISIDACKIKKANIQSNIIREYLEIHQVKFEDELRFIENNIIGKLDFKDVSMENILFGVDDFKNINFIGCKPLRDKKNKRDILYNEAYFDNNSNVKIVEYEIIEKLYRDLKKKYAEEHNWPEVSNWHYNEKLFQLKLHKINGKKFAWISNGLYMLSSGYNERFKNAFWMLIILLLVFGFVAVDGICFKLSWFGDWFARSMSFVPVVGNKETIKDATGFGKVGFMLAQLWIVIQLGLLGMTVRNKLRR